MYNDSIVNTKTTLSQVYEVCNDFCVLQCCVVCSVTRKCGLVARGCDFFIQVYNYMYNDSTKTTLSQVYEVCNVNTKKIVYRRKR